MIEIDSWEKHQRSSDFPNRLIKLCQTNKIDCEIVPLGGTGDIRFYTYDLRIVLIERKSTSGDLFSSASKRLVDQCLRLIDEADWPILLIDGPMTIGKNGYFRSGQFQTGWKFSSIAHMLLSLQSRGLKIIWVPKASHTPQEIVDLYRYFQKKEHTSLYQNVLKPFPTNAKGLTPREEKIRVLLSLSGVGPELASRLIDIFGSPSGVGKASLKGLIATPGINEKLAKKIKDTLNGS